MPMYNKFKIKCKIPSGKTIYIPELYNEEFYTLQKYVTNGDILGFYSFLDNYISSISPDFINLNLLDKFYCYLALIAYCIKPNLELQNDSIETFGIQNVYSLFDALDNISEIKFDDICLDIESKIGNIKVFLSIPNKLEEISDVITFDPKSAIKKIIINSDTYFLNNSEDYEVLNAILNIENYNKIIEEILKNYNFSLIIIKDKIELPLLNSITPKFFAESLFFVDLSGQLDLQYIFMRHLNVSPNEYKKMTPIDSTILMNKFITEKKEEAKRQEDAENNNSSKNALDL